MRQLLVQNYIPPIEQLEVPVNFTCAHVVSFPDPAFMKDKGLAFARNLGLTDLVVGVILIFSR